MTGLQGNYFFLFNVGISLLVISILMTIISIAKRKLLLYVLVSSLATYGLYWLWQITNLMKDENLILTESLNPILQIYSPLMVFILSLLLTLLQIILFATRGKKVEKVKEEKVISRDFEEVETSDKIERRSIDTDQLN